MLLIRCNGCFIRVSLADKDCLQKLSGFELYPWRCKAETHGQGSPIILLFSFSVIQMHQEKQADRVCIAACFLHERQPLATRPNA